MSHCSKKNKRDIDLRVSKLIETSTRYEFVATEAICKSVFGFKCKITTDGPGSIVFMNIRKKGWLWNTYIGYLCFCNKKLDSASIWNKKYSKKLKQAYPDISVTP